MRRSGLVSFRDRMQAGQRLYECGEPFRHIYAVRHGSLKSYSLDREGNEQVLAFHLPGEFAGLDAIFLGIRPTCTVTLEESAVCILNFEKLMAAATNKAKIHESIYAMMSREIYQYELFFGDHPAAARVAAFLLNLSVRLEYRGIPCHEFELAMTRADVGSYLRMATETVSRHLHQFHRQGLIAVDNRMIRILETSGLEDVAHAYGHGEH